MADLTTAAVVPAAVVPAAVVLAAEPAAVVAVLAAVADASSRIRKGFRRLPQ